MTCYVTRYYCPTTGKRIDTSIWASSYRHAKELVKDRKINEVVDPFLNLNGVMLPSEWFIHGDMLQCLHAANWLGHVACAAGIVKGEELLSDNGIIHNLVHLMYADKQLSPFGIESNNYARSQMYEWLIDLEARTPGFNKKEYSKDYYITYENYEARKSWF